MCFSVQETDWFFGLKLQDGGDPRHAKQSKKRKKSRTRRSLNLQRGTRGAFVNEVLNQIMGGGVCDRQTEHTIPPPAKQHRAVITLLPLALRPSLGLFVPHVEPEGRKIVNTNLRAG